MTKQFSADEAGKIWKVRDHISIQTEASGVTGDIITINAPAGQIVRLHTLSTDDASAFQDGISIESDGEESVSLFNLGSNLGNNGKYISRYNPSSSPNISSASMAISDIFGGTIVIKKDAGNTTEGVQYAYEVGVFE